MTIHHHPSDALLMDYAWGALGEAWSLAIATHLALCSKCRGAVAQMEVIGGGMLEAAEPMSLSDGSFDALMGRLDDDCEDTPQAIEVAIPCGQGQGSGLPQPLRRYAENTNGVLEWRRLGLGASQLLIPTGEDGVSARLLRIPAGRPVPEHSHGGLELTLVLSGAFSDATGLYGAGDFQEADETLEHQPHAEAGEDCICLAITDAPLQFKSFAARMVQPFLGI